MKGSTEHSYLIRGAFGDYYAERYNKNRMLRAAREGKIGSY